MLNTVFGWWLELFHHGLVGPLIALVIAAFVVLIAGNVVIWTLASVKAVGRETATGFKRGYARAPKD